MPNLQALLQKFPFSSNSNDRFLHASMMKPISLLRFFFLFFKSVSCFHVFSSPVSPFYTFSILKIRISGFVSCFFILLHFFSFVNGIKKNNSPKNYKVLLFLLLPCPPALVPVRLKAVPLLEYWSFQTTACLLFAYTPKIIIFYLYQKISDCPVLLFEAQSGFSP